VDWPSQCAVVIPCLNEAATIGPLVEQVRRILPQVWVVDDGSHDGTAALAREMGACVVRFDKSRGKGVALKAGWQAAWEERMTWAICMDGDGQHAVADIPRFLERASEGGADLIIGNRMTQASSMPWLRRQVNKWMSARLTRLAGLEVADSQCGFRMMRLDAWSGLDVRSEHYEIESEVLLAFARRGFNIGFVPVQSIYGQERSKIHPVRDTWRWLCWLRSNTGR
jgi:glycosyltransferase involved in cell wall biosynthesis